MTLALDARQTAMLAEMGVWLPPQPKASRVASGVAITVDSTVQISVTEVLPPHKPTPVIKLQVRETAPSKLDIAAPTFYRINNLSSDLLAGIQETHAQSGTSHYKLVVVGEPMTGDAKVLWDHMLRTLGLSAGQVFVAELGSARAESVDKPPFPEHAAAQVASLKAASVLALGPHAAKAMLQQVAGKNDDFADQPFSKLREATMLLANPSLGATGSGVTSLVATFHPAQLLRTPAAKARAWQDLKRLRALLAVS